MTNLNNPKEAVYRLTNIESDKFPIFEEVENPETLDPDDIFTWEEMVAWVWEDAAEALRPKLDWANDHSLSSSDFLGGTFYRLTAVSDNEYTRYTLYIGSDEAKCWKEKNYGEEEE